MSTSVTSTSATTLMDELLKYQEKTKQSALDKLGTDLQSGNLAAAQSDFATLTGDSSSSSTTTSSSASSSSTTASKDPVVEDLVTLSKDLKSGDTAAAEKDYTALKSDLKKAQSSSSETTSADSSNSESQELLTLLQSLGTSTSTAASAYSSNTD